MFKKVFREFSSMPKYSFHGYARDLHATPGLLEDIGNQCARDLDFDPL